MAGPSTPANSDSMERMTTRTTIGGAKGATSANGA